MGQAQPIPINIRSVPRDPHFEAAQSGVRVTGSLVHDIEEKIQLAYLKGKQDGGGDFSSNLEKVMAETYDSMHTQLAAYQNNSIQNTEKLVSFYLSKIISPFCFILFNFFFYNVYRQVIYTLNSRPQS